MTVTKQVQAIEPLPVRGDIVELPIESLLLPFKKESQQITPTEVDQGSVADCCLPAVLAAMANTAIGRNQISGMITLHDPMVVRSL